MPYQQLGDSGHARFHQHQDSREFLRECVQLSVRAIRRAEKAKRGRKTPQPARVRVTTGEPYVQENRPARPALGADR